MAGAPAGSELVVATPAELAWFEPLYSKDRSYGWGIVPGQAGAIIANTPGHASGVVTVAGGARYAVWVQGNFPRPVEVQVNGRTVGWASGSDTPGQWTQAATLPLTRGSYTVRIVKPAGHNHLGPGEWQDGIIGAAALQRETAERLRTVPTSSWRTLCGGRADWVELVRP